MIRRHLGLYLAMALLLAAVPASAQVAISNGPTQNAFSLTTGAPSTTFAHTTTAGGLNRLLIVAVHMNVVPNTAAVVSGVTYGGVAMTQAQAITDAGNDTRTEIWYLLNPLTGSNSVVVTGTNLSATATQGLASATSFTGVDQTTPGSIAYQNNGNSGTPSSTLVSAAGELVVDYVTVRQAAVRTATGAGQTLRYEATSTAPITTDDVLALMSTEPGAASVTMSYTTTSRRWSQVGGSLRPASTDVSISQVVTPDPVNISSTTTFVYTVTNTGNSSATVSFSNTLPAGFTIGTATPSQGSCTAGATTTCSLGTIAGSGTATITITATAPATAGNRTNTGTITVTGATDTNAANDTTSATVYVQNPACPTSPGKDGTPAGALTGIVNTYFPGTASAAATATSITLGASSGSTTPIAINDLLLVIQMQDAAVDSNNDERYGDGTGTAAGTTGNGSGSTNLNNAGRYEYVVATNAVTVAGGTLNFIGSGGGNGLIYSYTNAAATLTQGQRRFQVVRVPQYANATLSSTLTALQWNGTVGGVLAMDVAGTVTLNGATVSVNGLGFRGGAGEENAGGAAANTDYRMTDVNAHGIKAEGIAGTPRLMYNPVTDTNTNTGAQGYPNGDYGRGAPGNAGGGGNDGNPTVNDQNSGGGGGGNGGAGGQGGNTWNSNLAIGGYGGAAFTPATSRVILGGGGGAGSRNNTPGVVAAASGANGGGIVLFRVGSISGTGTITANGSSAFNTTLNDGGGGGGAGGSIVFLARNTSLTGLTLSANGGRGGNAWSTQAAGVFPGNRHGPGGGGAGGAIVVSSTPTSSSVTGGASGVTTTANEAYGAVAGSPGVVVTTATLTQVAGTRSGPACSPDLAVTIADSPDPVTAGNNITYTIAATNNGPVSATNAAITIATPVGTTFVSITPPVGWTCGTQPAAGGTGNIVCTKTTGFASGAGSGNFTLTVNVNPSVADGATINASVTVSATEPDPIPSNNTATASTAVVRRVDMAIVKSASPDPDVSQGQTLTYTLTVTANGPSRATNVTVSDPLPAGLTFVSVSPGNPTCVHSAGTVTCNLGTFDPGDSTIITITTTVAVNTTQLTNTATVTRTETDTVAANNSSTVITSVLAPTAIHMLKATAEQDRKGRVVVSWTTSFESDNLGFHLYRDSGTGRQQVNKQLIAGSAFFARGRELANGRTYRWKDKAGSAAFVQYWVEDIDLNGQRTLHGPITPALVSADLPDAPNTDTIADLGSVGGIFVSPRGVGAPTYPVLAPTRKQLEQQWELAKQSAVKLMITDEAWYRVTKAQLTAAGFDAGTDSRSLALFAEGIEQPMVVADGGDGVFDTNDAIEFYGIGIDTPATGARAYWLSKGKGKGLRLRTNKSTARGTGPASTPYTFQRVERTVFFAALTNNGDRDNFYGAIVSPWGATQGLTVEHLDTAGGNASLVVVIQGGTTVAHRVALSLNGHDAGTFDISSMDRLSRTISVPLSWLSEGANTLTLTALNGDEDISVVESLRLTYPHRLIADNDALKVTAGSGAPVTVDGFTTASLRAIDVTNPVDPIDVAVTAQQTGSTYRASFTVPDGGNRTILVLASTRIGAAAQIAPSRASTWNDKKNGADLVIVSARALASAAAPLEARREAEGIVTEVVDVQDLYDEFGYGERSPQAIREFLLRTREWRRQPKYVLLLGDASIDPRNYLGMGTFDLVPTKLIATAELKTASDDWFGDSLAIGRLPVRTLAEAQTVIGKIVNRQLDASAAWAKRALFYADENNTYDFEAAVQATSALLPSGITPLKVFAGSTSGPKAAMTAAFNDGDLVMTFFGHGSVDLWSPGYFDGNDAAALTNGTKLPVVVGMTCLNGYFHDLFQTSLAESLLMNPNGGAVAVWTSSSLTEPEAQQVMAEELFRRMFTVRLGDAILAAKAATTNLDVRKSWILFGDPSMKVR